ncbi:Uncharacterized protein FWK35_00002473 [Aphis craccivora]|uniref:Uncharacterized protein n=1 Tax=Aphis craccivora TaxID=307492 RepID=A0A6G0ZQN8_APHCR|nr:Uncharacterized protein FWK35_00002473 [Aphis craccivora]
MTSIVHKLKCGFLCRGRYTRMCCLRLTNVQHSKNCFARDNFSRTIFVVEGRTTKFSQHVKKNIIHATACLYFR